MIKYLFTVLIVWAISVPNSQAETYIREYTYKATEADSKYTSRIIALDQVKILLLQEIGTFIHHEINITKNSSGSTYASENVKAVTAGLTKVNILKEEWDGETYYLKAKIETDAQQVIDALESFKKYNSEENLKQLANLKANKIALQESRKEIERLRQELKNTKTESQTEQVVKKYIAEVNNLSSIEMGYKGFMASVEGDNTRATYWYLKSAEKGGMSSQFIIRSMYIRKKIAEEDIEKVIAWFKKAAEQGQAQEQSILGQIYMTGKDLERNLTKAGYWYTKAAEQDDSIAQYALSILYLNGKGVTQDNTKAVYWLTKAAKQGLEEAQLYLVELYIKGVLVKQDDYKAAFWMIKLAEQGNVEAQYALAWMYIEGKGVDQDYSRAVDWIRKAAEQDHAEAQFFLYRLYLVGKVVEQSDSKAVYWLQKAAENGIDEARQLLNEFDH